MFEFNYYLGTYYRLLIPHFNILKIFPFLIFGYTHQGVLKLDQLVHI